MTVKPKTIEATAETATAAATAPMEQAQAKLKQGYDRAVKTAEQLAEFNKGNVEALVASSKILATGLQDISKHVATTAKANLDETVSTFRALSGVKSLKEAIDIQTSFARTSFEKAIADSGKLTETSLKLAEQAYAPLTARLNVAVETFTTRA
jgi:phasin family protein